MVQPIRHTSATGSLSVLLLLLAGSGCSAGNLRHAADSDASRPELKNRESVASRLDQASPGPGASSSAATGQTEYIASFVSAEEAAEHAAAVAAAGGSAHTIGADGHTVVATAPPDSLESVTVPSDAVVMRDTTWSARRPQADRESFAEAPDFAQNLLTARTETGVSALVERFPEADGRGVTVAVLDTGIEFKLPGISTFADGRRKVLAHHDLTEFGRVKALATSSDTYIADTIDAGGVTLQAGPELKGLALLATGVLDEAAIAQAVREPAGVDFNENGKTDRFPFVVTRAADQTTTVWIDADLDGTLSGKDREELSDFNSTGRSIDMVRTSGGSGAALAVTLFSDTEMQFHQIRGGHGTSCASIVAGNKYLAGRVDGMAPGSHLLSYVIDATGRDVYKSSTLLEMFLHARDEGADAISVSWGFATADLAAAQAFARVLDREVSARGVVMGFAAGNSGPGSFSAAADDYIPHLGYGLGAAITETQARNVYKWLGVKGDHVIYYSSVGPTRNGRAVPDLISPLMTLVRGRNDGRAGQFVPFGGTSSATPAFIGSVSALLSALRTQGMPVDTALLKTALLSSARSLADEPAARQGAGMVDVNAAYDRYAALVAEAMRAKSDKEDDQGARPAYDLRASVSVQNRGTEAREGLVLRTPARLAQVNLSLEKSTLSPAPSAGFVEVLRIEHTASWLDTPDVVTVQWTGGSFPVALDVEQMREERLYQDEIRLIDASGNTRVRIPVHVEVPTVFSAKDRGASAAAVSWQGTLEPFSVKRFPIEVAEGETVLSVSAAVHAADASSTSTLMITLFDAAGSMVSSARTRAAGAVTTTSLDLEALPAGRYEAQVYQLPGTLPQSIGVTFGMQRSAFRLMTSVQADRSVDLLVINERGAPVDSAQLVIVGREYTVPLQPDVQASLPAFKGTWTAAPDEKKNSWWSALGQPEMDRMTMPFLDLAVAFNDTSSGSPVSWDWMPVNSHASRRFSKVEGDESSSGAFLMEVYPNVGEWERLADHPPVAWIRSELNEALQLALDRPEGQEPSDDLMLQGVRLDAAAPLQGQVYGQLVLKSKGTTVATMPLELTLSAP